MLEGIRHCRAKYCNLKWKIEARGLGTCKSQRQPLCRGLWSGYARSKYHGGDILGGRAAILPLVRSRLFLKKLITFVENLALEYF